MNDVPQPYRLLFVCTGNTCRSPLAEALARREIAARGWRHVEVGSAGVSAFDGSPASDGSLRVAEAEGLDLSAHRARSLHRAMVDEADLVLTMSSTHVAGVEALGGDDKVELLTRFARGSGVGVPDPFGGDDALYVETFRVLEDLVTRALDRLTPVLDP